MRKQARLIRMRKQARPTPFSYNRSRLSVAYDPPSLQISTHLFISCMPPFTRITGGQAEAGRKQLPLFVGC
jgi:hypothetical protein